MQTNYYCKLYTLLYLCEEIFILHLSHVHISQGNTDCVMCEYMLCCIWLSLYLTHRLCRATFESGWFRRYRKCQQPSSLLIIIMYGSILLFICVCYTHFLVSVDKADEEKLVLRCSYLWPWWWRHQQHKRRCLLQPSFSPFIFTFTDASFLVPLFFSFWPFMFAHLWRGKYTLWELRNKRKTTQAKMKMWKWFYVDYNYTAVTWAF